MTIGAGVFLLAIGAILAFAVDDSVGWLDLSVVGWVLMLAGVLGLILGFVQVQRRRVVSTTTSAPPTVVSPTPGSAYPQTTEVVETDAPPPQARRTY